MYKLMPVNILTKSGAIQYYIFNYLNICKYNEIEIYIDIQNILRREGETMINSLKALGDLHRQSILRLLAEQEMSACEIIHAIGLSQPAIAYHLKILVNAKLINSQKEGKNVFYTLNKEGLKECLDQMNDFLEDLSGNSCSTPKPSRLRQNPNLCRELGYAAEICESEIHEKKF